VIYLSDTILASCCSCGGKKSAALFDSGVELIKDIPPDYKLNDKQRIQIECEKSGKIHVNTKRINEFLSTLKEPLHYLDFETFGDAVPLYDGTKPYQQIPFQYSLHTVDSNGTKHYSFLHDDADDPSLSFLKSLKESLGDAGTVIVYNQSFEQKILRALANKFPEYKDWVEIVIDRMVDLLVPFRNFDYYNPVQRGSASIKKVLPAITGKGYENMDIADGMTASFSYLDITFRADETTPEEIKKIREDLEQYCKLDTEGMIWIVDELKKLVE